MILEGVFSLVALFFILVLASIKVTWFRLGLVAAITAVYYIVNYINIEV